MKLTTRSRGGAGKLIYFENQSMDPAFNQAFEETVFEKVLEDDVFLLWRNGPAVVCGRYQNIFAEVDVKLAMENDVALIRRISGGGTVYHDPGNINYTFIQRAGSTGVSYDAFLLPVIKALEDLGVKSEIILSSAIAVEGKKISGSAQRKVKDRVLHHGTLLYDCDLSALRSLANGERSHFFSKATPSTPFPVTNLKELIPDGPRKTERFMERLLDSFSRQFSLNQKTLEEVHVEEVRKLAVSRYRSWDWTFGKNPGFSFSRSVSVCGKEHYLEYSSQNGIIDKISLIPEIKGVSEALEGKRLHPEDLQKALEGCTVSRELIHAIL